MSSRHQQKNRWGYFVLYGLIGLLWSLHTPTYGAITIPFSDNVLQLNGSTPNETLGSTVQFLGNIDEERGPEWLIGAPNKKNEAEEHILAGTAALFYNPDLSNPSQNLLEATVSLNFNQATSYFSRVIAGNGDLDGDHRQDFVIANIKNNPKELGVFLAKDSPTWNLSGSVHMILTDFNITNAEDHIPQLISIQGDVNGDGYDDFLVGSDTNQSGSNPNGSAYLLFGRPHFFTNESTLNLESSPSVNITFKGEYPGDGAGYNVAIIPDINADGYDDILISAFNINDNAGHRVYLIYGEKYNFESRLQNGVFPLSQSDAIFYSKANGTDGFGETVAGLGDINGDGFGDFIIGAPQDNNSNGAIYIYYGGEKKPFTSKSPSLNAYTAKLSGSTETFFGRHAISAAGDINGDLYHDFIVGEYANTNSRGKVYVFLGNATPLSGTLDASDRADYLIVGENNNDQVGFSLSRAGDLNSDGIDEIMVGANTINNNTGAVGLFQFSNNSTPNAISAIRLYESSAFTTPLSTPRFQNRDWVYVELDATDQNIASRDICELLVSSNSAPKPILIRLLESDINSGIYRGQFQLVRSRSSETSKQLSGSLGDTFTVRAKDNPEQYETGQVINAPAVINAISTQQIGTNNNTQVVIQYELSDYDNDISTFTFDNFDSGTQKGTQVQYSHNGLNWTDATITGSITNLSASENGSLHSIDYQALFWNAFDDIGVTDNTFFLRLKAHDGTELGNYSTSNAFQVDTIPPLPPVLSDLPQKHAYFITVTGNAEANSLIHIFVNNQFQTSGQTNNDGIFEVFPVSVSENTSSITAIAEDMFGFRSPSSNSVTPSFGERYFELSDDDLSVSLTLPLNSVTNDRTILFSKLPTQSITATAPVLYDIRYAFSLSVNDNQDSTPFQSPITVTLQLGTALEVANGLLVLYLNPNTNQWESSGIALSTSTTDTISFSTTHFSTFALFQLSDPILPIISPIRADNAILNESSFFSAAPVLSATLLDTDSGIATWDIQIKNLDTDTVAAEQTIGGLNSTENITVSYTPGRLADGRYRVQLTAYDHSHNMSTQSGSMQINSSALEFNSLHAPNPFNPEQSPLTIGYSLSIPVDTLDIYIFSLDREIVWHFKANPLGKTAGYHSVEWDGRKASSSEFVRNGVYYAYCLAKKDTVQKKIKLKIAVMR